MKSMFIGARVHWMHVTFSTRTGKVVSVNGDAVTVQSKNGRRFVLDITADCVRHVSEPTRVTEVAEHPAQPK